MAERVLSIRTYTLVCAVLIVLSVLTVAASFAPLPELAHLIIGLTIALCKATLVALFFMHVLFSPKVTWLVILVACFWLLILMALTLADYFNRNLVPFTPGH
jgi:cytochrome c oxidase subunit 4